MSVHPRYRDPNLDPVWTRQADVDRWAQIERALLIELTDTDPGPISIPVESVATRELSTGHEVGAFLELYEDQLTDRQHRRRLHWGLTSSDLVDTGRQFALADTNRYLRRQALTLATAVNQLPDLVVPGRTHGQPASPTSYRHRWLAAAANLQFVGTEPFKPWVMLSGATGRGRHLAPEHVVGIATRLGGQPIANSTQVMPAHAVMRFLNNWQGLVMFCEQVALDIRLGAMLQELTIDSVPVGSTAMPGKVNPAMAEQVCGLAKDWRAAYNAVAESRALWLDRDLHHSSVDRVQLPALAHLAGFMAGLVAMLLQARFRQVPQPWPLTSHSEDLLARVLNQCDVPRSVAYRAVAQQIWFKPDATPQQIYDEVVAQLDTP